MKKSIGILSVTLIAVMMFCVLTEAKDLKATLTGVKGDVKVKTGDDWAAAKDGMLLEKGASVKTGAAGEATLAWSGGEGNALKIFPLTVVKVDSLTLDSAGKSVSDFSMEKGRLLAKASKLKGSGSKFNVKTPTAVAGVRGSAFDCAMKPGTEMLTVSVVEGDIVVANDAGEVVLTVGFSSTVSPGEMPQEPIAIPASMLKELKSDVNKVNAIIKQAVAAEAKAEKKAAQAEKKEEAPAEEEEAPAGDEEAPAGDAVTDTVIDQSIEETTIQADIMDAAEANTCLGAGGCIQGTITITH